MKVYTRTGDDGSTALWGGARVSKSDLRVEAYGAVDEANAALGLARAAGLSRAIDEVLGRAQASLFRVGALLATPPGSVSAVPPVAAAEVEDLERAIDAAEASLPPLTTFVVPGGAEAAARLHLARTVVRRAERRVVALRAHDPVDALLVRYLNRLSDLLFVQARAANRDAGVPEVPWKGA
jgi:cob(I)alamin adenosyltransferase